MLEWYDIPNYEGIYQINLHGDVKNYKRNSILKKHIKLGYYYVMLSKNGNAKDEAIHRLLATTFLPNPQNKSCVDHINGIREDNRLENLRWATYKENNSNPNTQYKVSSGIKKSWDNGREFNYDKICKPVLCVETNIVYPSQKVAGDVLNIKPTRICAACRGRRGIAGGFHWRKIENIPQNELCNMDLKYYVL